MNFSQESANQLGRLVEGRLQQEMPAVEKVDLGIGQIAGEGLSARRTEDLVTTAQTASSGTWLERKYSWTRGYIGGLLA